MRRGEDHFFMEVSYTPLRKYVGHLYNAVDWTEVNTALRPPYRIRLDGTAEIESSADYFQGWTSAQLAENQD